MKKLFLTCMLFLVSACEISIPSHKHTELIDETDMIVKVHNSNYYSFMATYLNQAKIQSVGSACEYLQPYLHESYGCAMSPAVYYYDVRNIGDVKQSLGDFICLRMEKYREGYVCLRRFEDEANVFLLPFKERSHYLYQGVCLADHDKQCKQIEHPEKAF